MTSPPSGTPHGLRDKQRRFADLVLGGMPASRAYREAGYTAATNGAAEASASRLLRSAKVAAYLGDRRGAAAERAGLTLAGILAETAAFARDKSVDAAQRLAAYKLLAEHLARNTPAPPIVVQAASGAVTEHRVAALQVAVLEAAVAGRVPLELADRVVALGNRVQESVVAATLSREFHEQPGGPAAPTPWGGPLAPVGHPVRPKWYKPLRAQGGDR